MERVSDSDVYCSATTNHTTKRAFCEEDSSFEDSDKIQCYDSLNTAQDQTCTSTAQCQHAKDYNTCLGDSNLVDTCDASQFDSFTT